MIRYILCMSHDAFNPLEDVEYIATFENESDAIKRKYELDNHLYKCKKYEFIVVKEDVH